MYSRSNKHITVYQKEQKSHLHKQLLFIKELEKITNSVILTEQRGGVSDANIVSSCGVVTLDGFGPFGDGDHTIKERASKDSFVSRIELSRELFIYFIKNSDFKGY